jgi:hypothetical protein
MVISVSVNDKVPRKGACAAAASGGGVKAESAIKPPPQRSRNRSAAEIA